MLRAKVFLTFLTLFALCLSTASPLVSRTIQQQSIDKGQGVRQVAQLPAKAKRYALLIGVDSYDDGQISGLRGAANDTKALEAALVRNAGFDPDRIVRLASDQPREFQPTRGNILKYLSNILLTMPPDGLLWLAFSGHGVERNRRAFLLPADAQVNDDVKLLEKTAIEVADIKEMIREKKDASERLTGVSQVIILLDACRNDPTSGRDLSVNPMTKAYDFNLRNSGVQAFVTLYATSVGKRAYEDATTQQGFFISEVVEGLNGAAANERGEITLEQLIEHVEEKVPTKVSLRLGKDQRPFHEVEGYRSGLVIALANPTVPATVTPPVVVNTPSHPTALTPVIALPSGVTASALKSASFTTARVDANGRVTKLSGGPVQSLSENVNGADFEMVAIPGGRFQMGASDSENQAAWEDMKRYIKDVRLYFFSDAVPHWVQVNNYWIGKYEVTQGQWKAVMGSLPLNMSDLGREFKGDDLPVVQVSWDEAQTFIAKLNQMTGGGYRLPTEAEWEYAARGGTNTPFAFGAMITPEVVNYNGNYPYGQAAKGKYRQHPVAVGSLGVANGFGLYDMHGNVREWCSDWYGPYPTSEAINPKGTNTGLLRVLRGGDWSSHAVGCRSAFRNRMPAARHTTVGFRLVRQ